MRHNKRKAEKGSKRWKKRSHGMGIELVWKMGRKLKGDYPMGNGEEDEELTNTERVNHFHMGI